MGSEEAINEIARLRYLDKQRRRISEEAESTLRAIRERLHDLAKNLREAHSQLRYHSEQHASESVMTADWARCDELFRKLDRL